MRWVILLRQDVLYVLWKELKLHEIWSLSHTQSTRSGAMLRLKGKFTFTSQNNYLISSYTAHVSRPTFRDVLSSTHEPQFLLTESNQLRGMG
jgi:hypothetical protein